MSAHRGEPVIAVAVRYRAVQEVSTIPVAAVLHQCIRLLIGAFCSEPSWVSARVRSD